VGTPWTGLGEPRQGTHLSMLRTTHPHRPEGALPHRGGKGTLSLKGRVTGGEGSESDYQK